MDSEEKMNLLVKKAYSLDCMVKRGELTIRQAAIIMEAERGPYMQELTDKVLEYIKNSSNKT